jgi:hypothetical protein
MTQVEVSRDHFVQASTTLVLINARGLPALFREKPSAVLPNSEETEMLNLFF